ncbi:MAG: hypothetical protein RLY20_546, partial [Verrucomicrobiota bacterium]
WIIRAMNSGPLSLRMYSGAPCCAMASANTPSTSSALIVRSPSSYMSAPKTSGAFFFLAAFRRRMIGVVWVVRGLLHFGGRWQAQRDTACARMRWGGYFVRQPAPESAVAAHALPAHSKTRLITTGAELVIHSADCAV